MECHRHRNWNVYANHTYLDPIAEIPRRIAITGKYCRTIAILMIINHLYRFIIGFRPDNTQYRSENFVGIDTHVGLNIVKNGSAYKTTIF